jgi:hypothetical protein
VVEYAITSPLEKDGFKADSGHQIILIIRDFLVPNWLYVPQIGNSEEASLLEQGAS